MNMFDFSEERNMLFFGWGLRSTLHLSNTNDGAVLA